MIKVVTINILRDLDYWEKRRYLLAAGLNESNADIIGVQEVNQNKANFLLEKLDYPYIFHLGDNAILSRHPFIQQEIIELQTQGRNAQLVNVEISNSNHQQNKKQFIFCNGHYFWRPGSRPERMQQFQLLVERLAEFTNELPIISVGDFNSVPQHPEVEFLKTNFTSAYAHIHGSEPEYTCPTPLPVHRKFHHTIYLRLTDIFINHQFTPWRGTLDYIFVNQKVQVKDCQLILTEPLPENPRIYPSDHFGIVADLEF